MRRPHPLSLHSLARRCAPYFVLLLGCGAGGTPDGEAPSAGAPSGAGNAGAANLGGTGALASSGSGGTGQAAASFGGASQPGTGGRGGTSGTSGGNTSAGSGSGAVPAGGSDSGAGSGGAPANGGATAGTTASGGTATGGNTTGGNDMNGGAGGIRGGSGGASSVTGNITVWLAGDSTVAKGNTPCPVGWGAAFDALFDERVTVRNSAVGGRSVRTWLYNVRTTMDASGECELERDAKGEPTLQARWQTMLNEMKPGDYLFIQFGINDGSPTCDRHVGLAAFKESYGVMARAAKMRGAQPVFVTPVSAIACNGTTARGTRGGYVTATIEAGTEHDVPVIDLHALSVELYDSLGFCPVPGGDVTANTQGAVGAFFCDDHTHFDRPGAERIAELVAHALRAQGLPLAAYLR